MNLIHAVATGDLIAELERRKRIRIVTIRTEFFNGNSADAGYMRATDSALITQVGVGLHNELCITFKDEVLARDDANRPTRTSRQASLMVLVPEGVDDDAD